MDRGDVVLRSRNPEDVLRDYELRELKPGAVIIDGIAGDLDAQGAISG